MKHILFVLITALCLVSCNDEDWPKASLDLYELEDVSATAGNKLVTLSWTPSDKRIPDGYFISWSSGKGDNDSTLTIENGNQKQATIDGLANRTAYTFSVQPIYGDRRGAPLTVSATPKSPYANVSNFAARPGKGQVTLSWSMPEEVIGTLQGYSLTSTSEGQSITITDPATTTCTFRGLTDGREYTFTIISLYDAGESDSESISATPGITAPTWSSASLTMDGYTGAVKASNPVFSPDGLTMYVPTSNKKGNLFAVDALTGNIKWMYSIPNVTYGGGACVGSDGTIYQGDQKGVVYAITSGGDTKWTFKTGGKIEGFPAITSNDILYIAAGESATSTIYAFNAKNGNVAWKQTVDGNVASAVAVDANGNVYLGTNKAIYSYTADGTKRWETTSLNVTERGSFAISGNKLYAALKSAAGVAAIDLTTGNVDWTSGLATGDAYFPTVGNDGSIYFTDKGSKCIIAITATGSQKWKTNVGANLIYAGLSIADNGIAYTGTQGKANDNYHIIGIDTSTGAISIDIPSPDQMMSASIIGEDNRLYIGTVSGKINATDIGAVAAQGWTMRGGNLQGTNSLK